MLVKQELINKIKDYFDLNVYETKIWLALLGKGVASAGEIATISGVPRSRTYDVLESLEKKGFAIIKLGKPVKYLGVKPRIILEKMKGSIRRDAEDKIVMLSNIKETEEFQKLEEMYKGAIAPVKREDLSASIKGKSNISNHLREILQNAQKEVIICTDVKDLLSKIKLFQQTFDLLKKANIKINLALFGDDESIKQAKTKFDVKIKAINIDTKFFIIDRQEILFYLSKNTDDEDIAIWLNSEFFTQAFSSLFERAVKSSK
jgi:HTH-type transcriptional regulator, sugar sensing transcriptional regulator